MLDKRIRLTQLQYERELAGACSSITKDGFEINPHSTITTELSKCSNIIRRKSVVAVAPKVNPEIEILRQQNIELRQQLTVILKKLDKTPGPVTGGF